MLPLMAGTHLRLIAKPDFQHWHVPACFSMSHFSGVGSGAEINQFVQKQRNRHLEDVWSWVSVCGGGLVFPNVVRMRILFTVC